MFTYDLNEDWDSTETQEGFIHQYFGKEKICSKKIRSTSKFDDNYGNDNTKNCESTTVSSHFRKKHVLSHPSEPNKKRKKTKKSFDVSAEDNCLDIYDHIEFQKTNSWNSGSNKLKLKKKKPNISDTESLNPKNCFEELSTESESNLISYDSAEKNSLKESDANLSCLKKKKKKHKKKCISTEETSELVHDTEKLTEDTNTSFNVVSYDTPLRKDSSFQNKMQQKLQAAKFRYLNEMIYTCSGKEALSYFQQNKDEFQDYHKGYQSQVSKWPINPVDKIIQEISQMNSQVVIADLGCGEAKIADAFPKKKVYSFDLISVKDCITACDIANVPLPNGSVDVVIFCLSLMGTNWKDYVKEAHRLLKFDGLLKIAEIESRIENLHHFVKNIEKFGFSLVNKNLSHKMFVFLNFKKVKSKKSFKVPDITLKPCLYKKR